MARAKAGGVASRSTGEWVVRLLAASVVVAAGYVSVTQSLGYALKDRPTYAHLLAPSNGQITARLAQTYLTPQSKASDFAEAERLAVLALKQDATAVRAVAALGLSAQAKGDVSRAKRYFSYADKLSRRDLQTQLWLIEDAVARNDISGALRQYDIALRTSRVAPDVLYPVLARAVDDPQIRSALVRTLAAKPDWAPNFTLFAAANSPSVAVVDLFVALHRAGFHVTDEPFARLIARLVGDGRIDDAWRYFAVVRNGANPSRSRDPDFVQDHEVPTLFDWVALDGPGITTSLRPSAHGGSFDFSAAPSVGGALLRQMQMLPPGDYRIEGRSRDVDQPVGSRPFWILNCQDGREIGRVDLPNSSQSQGAFAGQFRVPSDCRGQSLTLVARPSAAVSGTTGEIDHIRIVPASQRP